MTTILVVKRVIYGKKETPLQDREYKIDGFGPVGNMQDWLEYAQQNGYLKVEFFERDGTSILKEI